MKPQFSSLLALSALYFASTSARAADIMIDDASPSEKIIITVNDFEGGFLVNGALIQIGLGSPGSVSLDEGAPIDFLGRWIDNGASGTGARTIYLVESSDPSLVSDVFRWEWSTDGHFGTIHGTFFPDTEGSLVPLPPGVPAGDVFVENGRPVTFDLPFLTGRVLSDDETHVPETVNSGALMGVMFVGLAGMHKILKRRRSA